jgi:hypothetical protein
MGRFAEKEWRRELEAVPERNLNLRRLKPERSREKKLWLVKYR